MNVRKAITADMKALVEVHCQAFPGFFLTTLGKRFLILYYDSVNRLHQGVMLGAFADDGKCLGFCAATLRSAGFNRKLILSRPLRFAGEAILLLVSRLNSLVHIFRNMTKSNSTVDDRGEYAELLSIAVSPDAQGLGVGSQLLEALDFELKQQNVHELSLTTDACDNDAAIGFYRKNGFQEYYQFTAYPDRKMYRLNKRIQ